jgi:hypothetical protein
VIACGWTRMRRSSLRASAWHDGDSHGGAVLSSGAHTASPAAALAPPLYFVLVTLIVGILYSEIQALDPTQAIHTFF